MNQSQINMAKAINNLSEFLWGAKPDKILVEKFEDYYKKLRGIKKFYDNAPWDDIVKEPGMEEVILARQDEPFKKYYKLRQEIDRLEVFAR